ncbi:MAG: histone deacetylase family protein [Rhodobacteraceae bacterium]|nr:histone deacetylase family protein [Paracoccaceae bacterium]MBR9821392.1 histone deacetylase family protein [Paracoccaceae bacterium]
MTTALFTHPDCLSHVTPEGHPEQVARLSRVLSALEGKALDRHEAPLAEEADLLLCHPQGYIDRVRGAEPAEGQVQMDPDTWMSPGSYRAALRSAGGAIAAVDAVLDGRADNAFVATRPPGHHAETESPMGFCLFGNVALAAKHALERRGLSRVAIFDPDVHHGNGTQDLVQSDPRILFISTHQQPLYPGTGNRDEFGPHDTIRNIPLSAGTDGETYRMIVTQQVLPKIRSFAPELILLSSGFDAHRDDPLASVALETQDFRWLTDQVGALAGEVCGGRLVSCLEGGYNLDALAEAAAVHVDGLIAAAA